MSYVPTIGLEVHAQLNTKTKLFCNCKTTFASPPNSNVCPVCLGLPGALPVLNQSAVDKAILAGLAFSGKIQERFSFDRKNYFYPDLPKGYQISQLYHPYCYGGGVEIATENSSKRKIPIHHIHIEEDAGKLIHSEDSSVQESYVDLNRAGTPLIEIVSEPDINTIDEAYLYLTELKSILRYIDASDCNMEEGSLRCDANISIREETASQLGTRVEIKNLNSFKAVRSSLEYEIERQKEVLLSGGAILQETRLWDADKNQTFSMRSKEEANDYRYFPDLDLVAFSISTSSLKDYQEKLPELANEKKERFIKQYQIPEYDAKILTGEKETADYFENTMQKKKISSKLLSNWIMSELLAVQKQKYVGLQTIISEEHLAELIYSIESNIISGKIAKVVFQKVVDTQKSPTTIIAEENLQQITDEGAIQKVVDKVILENPSSVQDYLAGKERSIKHLMGSIMKETKGKANPKSVNELLVAALQKLKN